AAGWDRAGARAGAALGFDTEVLADAVDRQAGIESLAGPGTPLLVVTEPTETATAAAFAHTAVLAGRPGNAAPLAEAGRLFGRLAHLLDAVEDREADAAAGAWNPLRATGTSLSEARRLADDALHGIGLALRDAEFVDDELLHVLLAHELRRSVDRVFGAGACAHRGHGGRPPQGGDPYIGFHGGGAGAPHGGGTPYGAPYGGGPGGDVGVPPRFGFRGEPPKPEPRGFWAGCAVFVGLCCTCRLCCAEQYEGPWSRKKREGCCHKCDCNCGGCDCCCPCDGC
ncbi:hypothetical protein ACFWYA_30340, partial [Streptomyces sp. NPDC059011]